MNLVNVIANVDLRSCESGEFSELYEVANVLSRDIRERNSMIPCNEEPNLIFL